MSHNLPKLYSKADLAKRWRVSRQVVKNWENRHKNFPDPIMWVHNDTLPLYIEKDVIKYENERKLNER
ncbi:hypothetical protein [Gracilibacillus dipsosauri]|uniref:DNA-binding protein n=1 Tax=Gracilibacillus dipsosauri TaxID=178340 RepID=A0A317KXS4_9BACI|nr:hypothetical protein [Gracilibacillus dipsosauri]PWU68332.1 hypothetical protein DLJ74_07730 [Gracilibacillus dipsosauri]